MVELTQVDKFFAAKHRLDDFLFDIERNLKKVAFSREGELNFGLDFYLKDFLQPNEPSIHIIMFTIPNIRQYRPSGLYQAAELSEIKHLHIFPRFGDAGILF